MGENVNRALAATKLRPPQAPARLVVRSRLDQVLDDALASGLPLVLVSAPAGSGKSTLVANWVAGVDRAAWLQLDEADADPVRFWTSVSAAIGRVDPGCAARLAPTIIGSLGDVEPTVAAVVNELERLDERIVLVLDDYHLVDEPEVHRAVEQLLDRSPATLTTVIVTRVDPPFRLGRMRVRGRVTEVRAADLRFEPDEAGQLIGHDAAGLDERQLGQLCERTEGWAAGLVLAGLSLARSADRDRFVTSFHGDDRLVAGYLADEFLSGLDEAERQRMIEAAVLHRLSGALLDSVTGSTDGAQWLAQLAETNQLVIRLDTTGAWYRYHHLFRDLLLLEARRVFPERLPELHTRAAEWFRREGRPVAAVEHLLQAGDRDNAMDLMRIVGPDLLGRGQLRILRNLLDRLSADGDLDSICLLLAGWDRYLLGRYDDAERLLALGLERMPPDLDPMRAMPLRINLALGKGDVATALAGADEVVANGPVAERPSELITAVGAAFTWAGRTADAMPVLDVAIERTVAEQRITAHAMALVARAIVAFQTGDERATADAVHRALEFADSSGLGEYHGIAPVLALHAATTTEPEAAIAAAHHAVTVSRRATTTLGETFVLILGGDVLLRHGDADGATWLDEARALIARSADAGINATLLDRLASKHRLPTPAPRSVPGMVEQLTDRELAVLRLLPSSLSLRDIGRELYVSINTVKSQCSAIYRKLGVSTRAAAVQVARERQLL